MISIGQSQRLNLSSKSRSQFSDLWLIRLIQNTGVSYYVTISQIKNIAQLTPGANFLVDNMENTREIENEDESKAFLKSQIITNLENLEPPPSPLVRHCPQLCLSISVIILYTLLCSTYFIHYRFIIDYRRLFYHVYHDINRYMIHFL